VRKTPVIVLAISLVASLAHSQPPAFDVASVKRNTSVDSRQSTRLLPGGRVAITNMPLRTLIRVAYGATGSQVVGGPGWVASDGYDIVAKFSGDLPAAANGQSPELLLMLRTLLADRFKLRVHMETRPAATYALVVAPKGPGVGVAIKASQTTCDPPSQCGIRGGNGNVTYTGLTLRQIATSIAGFPSVARPVIDRTGLAGRYDLHLQFNDGPGSENDPNLFTALVEQAGLKLQQETGPVEFIVIDRAERPTED